ncbi:MAG: hypothetical protein PHI12_07880 [Dehalococcoidales bacterium]|nr:hypothetical protein [Dehalococcoidales bacterium]
MNRKDRQILNEVQESIDNANSNIDQMLEDQLCSKEMLDSTDSALSEAMDKLRELSGELEDRSGNVANLTQQEELAEQASNLSDAADSLEGAKEDLGELVDKSEFDELSEEALDHAKEKLEDAEGSFSEYL